MIRFEHIVKRYGQKTVLDGVSAVIPTGKITSLIGPNGAGKSTLLSIMCRLLKQEEGKVFLNDRELNEYGNKELAKKLSILKQSNNLDLKLTVRDLVSFGRFPYSNGRMKQEDWQKVEEAMAFCEITDLQDTYIDELSGGQRQRAFISMTMAQDTDYLLLDEPLNNLDMKHSVQVMKMLRRLVDELGKTVVIVIHEINFAAQYSDHIIAMKEGAICYDDDAGQVIQGHVLEDIFEMPFEIIERNNKKICNYFNL
ncbi:ABC transporter ATP-binding protein [Olivibacter sitiensis]|uniref:iron ABC transporter ATP-binding protein n=1 Tax=Olivibacter sitiensis TaxID=376470 RepID=UPI000424E24E|nr:ATP-binding cassette domain-containing protein [Olivibacter sitiensis]